MAREAGTSDFVRKTLRKTGYADVAMAPAADMFAMGVKLQVVRLPFVGRANKLYELWLKYNSIDDIPANVRKDIEKKIFKGSLEEVWAGTKDYYIKWLKDPETIRKAEEEDPKLKFELICKSYLGQSSGFAQRDVKGRRMDAQIWCGPAIGAYNAFLDEHPELDPNVTGAFPAAAEANLALLQDACKLISIRMV